MCLNCVWTEPSTVFLPDFSFYDKLLLAATNKLSNVKNDYQPNIFDDAVKTLSVPSEHSTFLAADIVTLLYEKLFNA